MTGESDAGGAGVAGTLSNQPTNNNTEDQAKIQAHDWGIWRGCWWWWWNVKQPTNQPTTLKAKPKYRHMTGESDAVAAAGGGVAGTLSNQPTNNNTEGQAKIQAHDWGIWRCCWWWWWWWDVKQPTNNNNTEDQAKIQAHDWGIWRCCWWWWWWWDVKQPTNQQQHWRPSQNTGTWLGNLTRLLVVVVGR